MGKLTALALKNPTKSIGDGDGLMLQVKGKSKSWIIRYNVGGGRVREKGLGKFPDTTLAMAREKAAEVRALVKKGIDPLAAAIVTTGPTFEQVADEYIELHRSSWRNSKHADQWASTLKTYAYPVIGTMPAKEVLTAHVIQVMQPIWQTKTETADRVRSRIKIVLAGAAAKHGWTGWENPAIWSGKIDLILPSRRKIAPVVHHSAMSWREAPAFMARLRQCEGVGARALEWTILTASRSGMTMGARWSEIDESGQLWNLPADRMKAGRPFVVPLSPAALAVLDKMRPHRGDGDWLFPGQKEGRPISNATMAAVLKRLNVNVVVHGFRSTFRDGVGAGNFVTKGLNSVSDAAEFALAHTVGGQTRAAYQREDMLATRTILMNDWSNFLNNTN